MNRKKKRKIIISITFTRFINYVLDVNFSFSSFFLILGAVNPKVNLCPEAVCVLLSMVRTIVHSDVTIDWLQSHPVAIIQVLSIQNNQTKQIN